MTGRIIIQEPMAVKGWKITPIKIHVDQFEGDCPPEWADYESIDLSWHLSLWRRVFFSACLVCGKREQIQKWIDKKNKEISQHVEDYKDDPVVFVEMIYHLGNPKTNLR